jgi:hypothetical protein
LPNRSLPPSRIVVDIPFSSSDALFAFEISHREHWDTEFRIIPDLRESVDYFRPVISD